jgi:hypothetical protein
MRRRALIAAILLSISWIAPAIAGKIEGTVKDPTGALVPKATVWAESAVRPWPSSVHTATDDQGHFVLDGLEAATWTVKARCPGFALGVQAVVLSDGETREITIELRIGTSQTEVEVVGKRSALANSDPNYRALRSAIPNESYRVENIELKRDVGTLTLRSGSVTFVPPVLNHVTMAVFTGEGRFQLKPAMPLEAQYLQRMTGKSEVDEEFTSAIFYFTDATYEEIKKDGHGVGSDASAANALRDFHNRTRRQVQPRSLIEALVRGEDMQNLEAELLAELSNPSEAGSFRAFLHGKHFSDLRFLVVPGGAIPQISSPEEVGLINVDPGGDREGIWYLTHRAEEWAKGAVNSAENKRVIAAEHYRIETTIGKNTHLASVADLRFRAVENGARVVRFGLLPALRVSRVALVPATGGENGREVPFIQEDRRLDGSFYAIMPAPMTAGQSYQLHVEYEGDHVVRSAGTGNFSVEARESWYPSINTFADRATYDLVFKVPKQYTLVSVGKLEKESKEGDFAVSEWKADVPLAVAGFNYGLFKKKQMFDDKTHYEIETYATQDLPDDLKEATGGMPISPNAMADTARVDGQNAIRLFEAWFGPCPYGRIAITQQPAFDFGQSWPTLVYLPISAFLDSTHRWMLMGGEAFRFASFIQEVTPHEVSHQWWGHMVGWASYHDQWLSEGFADFSAAVFLEQTEKPDQVNKFWDRAKEAITAKNQFGTSANEAGPIWMGLRLDTPKSPWAYNRLVYAKGAYILQMIRMLMHDDKTGDQDFVAMMQDYVKTFLNRNATSENFREMVEKHMNPVLDVEGNHRLDWFYRDWVYGTDLPKYRLEYSIKPGDGGKATFTGKLTQSEVSPGFAMRVPIYFDFDGHVIRAGYATLKGNMTSADMKINLPKKPKRVMLNAFHDVLASEAMVKEVQ